MSDFDFSKMSEKEKALTACTLAAMVLEDAKKDITKENVSKVLKAAKVNIPEYWIPFVVDCIDGKKLTDFMSAAPAPATAAP